MGLVDITSLSDSVGLPADMLGPGIILASSYILAIPYSMLKTPLQRNLFSIVTSGLQYVAFFDAHGYAQLLILSLICYYVTMFTHRSKSGPIVIFVIAMAMLSFNHLNTMLALKASKMDHTVPMMVIVQKVTGFAWACHDGTRSDEDLSDEQKTRVIRKYPSILDFLGFIFFYPAFLVGPSFDFQGYQQFIHDLPPFKNNVHPPLAGRLLKTLECFVVAVFMLVLHMALLPMFDFEFTVLDAYLNYPLWKRYLYVSICGFVQRSSFYVAWKLAEGACVLSGFGYNGVDTRTNQHKWNRCENVQILHIELAENPKMYYGAWNIQSALWLRRCVYVRICPETRKNMTPAERESARKSQGMATFLTFVVSAFWHGFWPGFYFSFVTFSLTNSCGRIARRYIRPIFHRPSRLAKFAYIYHILSWLCTSWINNYIATAFILHSVDKILVSWTRIHFIGHVFVVGMVVADVLGLGKVVKRFGKGVGADYGEHKGSDVLNLDERETKKKGEDGEVKKEK
ncbi:lysophospholipid acyltransferase [Chytridiales sp. JEL 0842]|nr:lysophospholipid acyltransferase [Chytridiales sp. JEL 0842]